MVLRREGYIDLPDSKHFSHPLVGGITVFHEATQLAEGDQYLFLYSVEPGSPSEDAMRRLESWVADGARTTVEGRTGDLEHARRLRPTGVHELDGSPPWQPASRLPDGG
jgi:hypothetical protein